MSNYKQLFTHSSLTYVLVAVWSVAWIYFGQSTFFVGPSEWDDVLYVELSTATGHHWSARNRYIHIWGLRLLSDLVGSRTLGVSLYPTLGVIALIWLCFYWGCHIGGRAGGVLAALLIPFFPALLKWISVPYVDPTVAVWGSAGLLTALLAVQTSEVKKSAYLFFATGIFLYFVSKTKETSIALLPAIAMAIVPARRKWGPALWMIVGFIVGWLILRILDHVYAQPDWLWRSSDWSTYWGRRPGPSVKATSETIVRMNSNYLQLLTRTDYLVIAMLAMMGAVVGFRESMGVRLLSGWLFFSLLLGSAAAWRSTGLFADERYLAAMAPPFVCLAAYGTVEIWKRATARDGPEAFRLLPWMLLLASVGIYSLTLAWFEKETTRSIRALFFMLPIAQVFLFIVPFLIQARWVSRSALILLLVTTGLASTREARAYVQESRERMQPWWTLARMMDKHQVGLVRHQRQGRPFPIYHIRRRIKALSARSAHKISVRAEYDIASVESNEWIFSLGRRNRELERKGWSRLVEGGGRDGDWSVYGSPNASSAAL